MRAVRSAVVLLAAATPAQAPPTLRVDGVDATEVRLAVTSPSGPFEIVELAPWETPAAARARPAQLEAAPAADGGPVVLRLPRFADGRDRLLGGFVLRDPRDRTAPPTAAWPTEPAPAAPRAPLAGPTSKKGLTCPVDLDDVAALGAAQVAINIQPTHAFLPAAAPDPGPDFVAAVEGERLRFDPAWVARLDAEVGGLTRRGAFVVAIVTCAIPPGAGTDHPLVHPRCDVAGAPHRLSAFRVTDRAGVAHFVGFLRFVAARYSHAGAPHGRIGAFVIGNEIDAHHEWHGMGPAPLAEVTAQHARELRLAALTVRSIHPDLAVFTSLTHAWNAPHRLAPGRALPARALLEALCAHPETAGLAWHVAFHPYPSDLFDPRFWNDRDAWFAHDTPKITLRNLEVLLDALRRPELGGGRRRVLLTEQGFHCADGGEDVQAAAYALAWRKVAQMDGVDGFLLHRHVDHRHEGGLRLGLWSCEPDAASPSQPRARRRIHAVFAAAGTARFDAVAGFAAALVGPDVWATAAPRPGPFPAHAPHQHPAMRDPGARSLAAALADAQLEDAAAYEPRVVDTRKGPLRGVLLHPDTGGRPARATVRSGISGRSTLRFAVAKLGAGGDGVRFVIRAGDRTVFTHETTAAAPRAFEVPLAPEDQTLHFEVDALRDTAWDHAVWLAVRVAPAVTRPAERR